MKLKDLVSVSVLLPTKLPDGMGIVDITGKIWMNEETYNGFLKQGKLMKVVEPVLEDLYIHIEWLHKDMPVGILEE